MNIIGTAGIRIIPSMAGFGASVGAAIAGGASAGALSRAGASASVLLTAPIIGGLAAGIGQAVSFESTFAEVKKTVNATDAEFAKLSQGVIDMSKVMPFAREEINQVLAAAGRFGIANDDLLRFTELAIQMGVATGQAPQQVAEQVTRMMNILGVAPENFEKFFSSIVGLGNEFPTTEANIISMGTRLSQISAVANVSEADVLGMATALSSLGIRAEMGGSAMARVFFKLSDLTKTGGEDLEKFTEAFGLGPAEDFAKFYERDAAGAVTAFLTRIRDMNAEGANTPPMLKEFGLGEIRVRDTILRASEGLDTWNRAMGTADAAYESGSALQQEYNKRLETTASQWQIFKNRVGAAALTFGTALLPMLNDTLAALQPVIDMIAAGAEAFAMLDEDTRKTVIAFGLIVAAAGPLLFVGGRVFKMFESLWLVFGLLGRGAMAHPVIAILTAIALIAILVITHWEEVREFFKGLWDDIEVGAQKAWDRVDGIWGGAEEIFSNLFKGDFIGTGPWQEDDWFPNILLSANQFGVDMWGGIQSGFLSGWSGFQSGVDGAVGGANWLNETFHHWIDPVVATMVVFWEELGFQAVLGGDNIENAAKGMWAELQAQFATGMSVINTVWTLGWPIMETAARVSYQNMQSQVFSPLADYWGPRLSDFASLTGEAWQFWWPIIEGTVVAAGLGIIGEFGELMGWFAILSGGIMTLWDDFDRAWQAMPVIVRTAIQKIKAELRGLRDDIANTASSLANGIFRSIPGSGLVPSAAYNLVRGRADDGGIVPGLKGQPSLILAHGGERILPTHKPGWEDVGQSGRSIVVQFYGDNYFRDDMDIVDVGRQIGREADREMRAQGG